HVACTILIPLSFPTRRSSDLHVALERALRLFRAAGGESEIGQPIKRSSGGGAAHVHHGEHGGRAASLSLFPEVRPANQWRKHARKRAGADRDRADPDYPCALHLRLSQPGAVTQMAATNFPGVDRK